MNKKDDIPDYEWDNEDVHGCYYFHSSPSKIGRIKEVLRNIPRNYCDVEDLWWARGN